MNEATRLRLRTLAKAAPPGPYQVQTSNSFRRIGTARGGDGDVLCGIIQRSDRHPDLRAAPGVLEFVVAAHPTAVLDLLDEHDRLVAAGEYLRKNIVGYDTVFEIAAGIALGQVVS